MPVDLLQQGIKTMRKILSYGGGKQTAALCVLVCEGALPRPDRIVMADTGRERSSTWAYLHDVIEPYLARHGLTVEIAPHTLATVDLYAHNGDLLIPAWTQNGKLPTYCSGEWKREVMYRYLRSVGETECETWIGFSSDEAGRAHESKRLWCGFRFPLLEMNISRWGCELLAKKAGLAPAPKSCCWCCPHMHDDQWVDLRDNWPDDWAKAVALEKDLIEADTMGGVYLHQQRMPLDLVTLQSKDQKPTQPTLGDYTERGCATGGCWT